MERSTGLSWREPSQNPDLQVYTNTLKRVLHPLNKAPQSPIYTPESPMYTLKCPIYPQKSPIYTQTSPIYPQMSPPCTPNRASSTLKQPDMPIKSPVYGALFPYGILSLKMTSNSIGNFFAMVIFLPRIRGSLWAYGVALVSRIDKMTSLFCKRAI